MPKTEHKARGNFRDNPNPRAWHIDFGDGLQGDDRTFLRNEIYWRNVELLA
ncbi:hypothetical protein [Arenibacterium sp. LLYu02]|uniref:hypothetical protein n=1 Tax=Arenibacterium sp. LLYu02 TaxID=3404132 RepID=UPI003B2128A5